MIRAAAIIAICGSCAPAAQTRARDHHPGKPTTCEVEIEALRDGRPVFEVYRGIDGKCKAIHVGSVNSTKRSCPRQCERCGL